MLHGGRITAATLGTPFVGPRIARDRVGNRYPSSQAALGGLQKYAVAPAARALSSSTAEYLSPTRNMLDRRTRRRTKFKKPMPDISGSRTFTIQSAGLPRLGARNASSPEENRLSRISSSSNSSTSIS